MRGAGVSRPRNPKTGFIDPRETGGRFRRALENLYRLAFYAEPC